MSATPNRVELLATVQSFPRRWSRAARAVAMTLTKVRGMAAWCEALDEIEVALILAASMPLRLEASK